MKAKILSSLLCVSSLVFSQTLAVFDIHSEITNQTSAQLGNLARLEVDKLGKYEVLDRFDMAYFAEQKNIKITDCYGKNCMIENGKLLNASKVLGGSVEQVADVLVVNLKLIDVASNSVEKSIIKEFFVPSSEIKSILELSLRELFGFENDQELIKKLTHKENFENTLTNPYASRLKLNGPRMGFTCFTGKTAEILGAERKDGGYGASPVMFQFGYQFETQYLNEGNYQGLFEFLPTVTGLDQGLFIPSFTLLNGLRNNKNGWEFAFGPTLSIVTMGKGYYDENANWKYLGNNDTLPTNFVQEKRLDSRSNNLEIKPGFLLAVGKSFRSGKLNIPVNFYIIPNRDGLRFGGSFGFNGKKNKQS
jgi:hypothetical protein